MLRNILFHLLFIITLAALLYLGFWQIERLKWKTELLQNIANQQKELPIHFPFDENSKKYEFQSSEVTGNFIQNTKIFFFRSNLKGESGFSIISERPGINRMLKTVTTATTPQSFKYFAIKCLKSASYRV